MKFKPRQFAVNMKSTCYHLVDIQMLSLFQFQCLQCFDAVGWAPGRASGL